MACAPISVVTAPLYRPGAAYKILDYSFERRKAAMQEQRADAEGRLTVAADCSGHEISITGPGAGSQPVMTTPLVTSNVMRPVPGVPIHLPIRVLNPRSTPIASLKVELSSDYPTVASLRASAERTAIGAGESVDLSDAFQVQFTAGDGDFARTRL